MLLFLGEAPGLVKIQRAVFVRCKFPNVYSVVAWGRWGIWINLSLTLHLPACQALRVPVSALCTCVIHSANIWSSLTMCLGAYFYFVPSFPTLFGSCRNVAELPPLVCLGMKMNRETNWRIVAIMIPIREIGFYRSNLQIKWSPQRFPRVWTIHNLKLKLLVFMEVEINLKHF